MPTHLPSSAAALALGEAAPVHGALPMALLGLVMCVTYALIATGRMHKVTAALTGGIVCTVIALATGVLHDYDAVHVILTKDIGVLGVIVGTSILVDISGRSGLFQFLAIKIAKRAKGDPERLFAALCALTVAFVSLLTIAPGTLIVASLALVLCRTLSLDPRPYLIGVALCANSGALVTFASGICTLMVGTAAGLPYLQFFIVSTPVALLTAGVAWAVVRRAYRGVLRAAPAAAPGLDAETARAAAAEQRATAVAAYDEWALVTDRRLFFRSALLLAGTVIGFALAQPLGVGLDFIAMSGGAAAILFSGQDPEEAIRKVNWTVILFFVGLFVMIGAVEHSGLLQSAAGGLTSITGGNIYVAVVVLVLFVAVTSGVMDNIPVAATMVPIVTTMTATLPAAPLWWSLVLAANLGGNGTPIGSISGVIALSALVEGGGQKVGWGEWFRVGGLTLILQLLVVLAWVLLFTGFDLFPALPQLSAGAAPAH
ncbi:MAG: SLC13 family permease [Planctomycetota bacterium]